MAKKILLAAAMLALVLTAGCLQNAFDAGYAKFREIKSRYVTGEQFLPENEHELELMKEELFSLQQSSSDAALLDFLNIEISKRAMQLQIVKARAALQGVNLSNVDCERITWGLQNLQGASQTGNEVLEMIGEFQKQHPAEFLKVDFERGRVSDLLLSVQNTAVYVNNLKQLTC